MLEVLSDDEDSDSGVVFKRRKAARVPILPVASPQGGDSFRDCTAQVVGSDDVAVSYYIGVLNGAPGWQKGRKSGGSCSRQLLSWRAPISSIP